MMLQLDLKRECEDCWFELEVAGGLGVARTRSRKPEKQVCSALSCLSFTDHAV